MPRRSRYTPTLTLAEQQRRQQELVREGLARRRQEMEQWHSSPAELVRRSLAEQEDGMRRMLGSGDGRAWLREGGCQGTASQPRAEGRAPGVGDQGGGAQPTAGPGTRRQRRGVMTVGKVVRGGRVSRGVPMGKPQRAEDPARSNRTLDRERVRQEKADEASREAHSKTVEGSQHTTF